MRIALSILFLTFSILIAFFYQPILEFFVINLKSGWVFGSIYVRLLVIIMFTISLYLFFSLFKKTKKFKFFIVFLIALLPGFGISFIAPIYDVDYGMFDDDFNLDMEQLSEATAGEFQFSNERIIVAFFTSTCPHCKAASSKIGTNIEAGQKIKVHTFFPGTREATDQFLATNNGQTFHSYLIPTDAQFTGLGGFTFPSIFVIGPDKTVEKHWTGDMINYSALDYLYELEP